MANETTVKIKVYWSRETLAAFKAGRSRLYSGEPMTTGKDVRYALEEVAERAVREHLSAAMGMESAVATAWEEAPTIHVLTADSE